MTKGFAGFSSVPVVSPVILIRSALPLIDTRSSPSPESGFILNLTTTGQSLKIRLETPARLVYVSHAKIVVIRRSQKKNIELIVFRDFHYIYLCVCERLCVWHCSSMCLCNGYWLDFFFFIYRQKEFY